MFNLQERRTTNLGASITELLDVIKKTGLPIGKRLNDVNADISADSTLRSGIGAMYEPQIAQLDEEKKQKIQRLANVDKEFSAIFGKGGKYALENPMATESLTAGGQSLRLNDFMTTAQKKQSLLEAFESDVAKASTLYGQVKPLKSEGESDLSDYAYLQSKYGLEILGLMPPEKSDWEVFDPEWVIDEQGNLDTGNAGIINSPPSQPKQSMGWPTMDNIKGLTSFQ